LPSWQPEHAANAAQERRSYTTPWGTILMAARRIRLIYLEIIFSKMHKNLPRLDEIYAFLVDRHFELVSFYQFYHQNERAGWTDALFAVNGAE
jgi:hypothetical protein